MSPIWVKFLGNWGEITLKIDRFPEAFTQGHKCVLSKNLPKVSKNFTRIYPPYPRHFPTLIKKDWTGKIISCEPHIRKREVISLKRISWNTVWTFKCSVQLQSRNDSSWILHLLILSKLSPLFVSTFQKNAIVAIAVDPNCFPGGQFLFSDQNW